jgi:hypothetical protein
VSPPAAEGYAQRGRSGGPLPWLCFGVATAVAIESAASELPAALDRLLVGASLAALATATLWIACLAFRRSRGWAWTIALGIWIPYVNLLIAAHYARRHWRDDAAAPGWLALAGLLAQLLVSLRLLFAEPPPLA